MARRRRGPEAGFVEGKGTTFDTDREARTGMKEVIFAPGKSRRQLVEVVAASLASHGGALVTRVDPETGRFLARRFKGGRWHERGRIFSCGRGAPRRDRTVAVVTAGAADEGVAEEAALTLEHLGWRVSRIYDVGVAGLHRLMARRETIEEARVVIAVAGMEGALASVVGGMTSRPVVAVPTSTGYGASFNGLAALLAMLNACSGGVAVVNIDGGFQAATVAHRVCMLREE